MGCLNVGHCRGGTVLSRIDEWKQHIDEQKPPAAGKTMQNCAAIDKENKPARFES